MRHQSKQRLPSHHYRNMELHAKLRDEVRYQDQYQSTRQRTLRLIDRFLDNKYTINSNKNWYTRYHRISQELSIGMVIPDRSSDNAIITSRFTDRKENESQAKEVHVITTCSTQRKHQQLLRVAPTMSDIVNSFPAETTDLYSSTLHKSFRESYAEDSDAYRMSRTHALWPPFYEKKLLQFHFSISQSSFHTS